MNARRTPPDSRSVPMENEEFERIAQRAADIVMDQVALRIGQGVLKLAGYLFVAAVVAAWAYVTVKKP